jgi:hypothetical protein
VRGAIILILFFALPAEAGPLNWAKHHKRFLLMEGAAIGAASIHAYGLHHCRQRGVEKCSERYGSAWQFYAWTTGITVVAMPAVAEGCWRDGHGKFCNVLAYGGSAAQLGFGISQWRKEKHAETDLRVLARR